MKLESPRMGNFGLIVACAFATAKRRLFSRNRSPIPQISSLAHKLSRYRKSLNPLCQFPFAGILVDAISLVVFQGTSTSRRRRNGATKATQAMPPETKDAQCSLP